MRQLFGRWPCGVETCSRLRCGKRSRFSFINGPRNLKRRRTASIITDRDDAEIVASVAEGFLRRLGREAPQHLRTEETRAERHGDTLSPEAAQVGCGQARKC